MEPALMTIPIFNRVSLLCNLSPTRSQFIYFPGIARASDCSYILSIMQHIINAFFTPKSFRVFGSLELC